MGHTNSTANLSLPQFIGTDKPTWLGDVNGAFSAIDSKVGTIDADISAVDAKADNAVADASNAVTTATNANNTAGTASTTATNALNVANNALTVANNADGHTNQLETKIGLLADLTTTDKTSIVNAINEVNAGLGGSSAPLKTVTADGIKTYSQLIDELFSVIANISNHSILKIETSSATYILQLVIFAAGTVAEYSLTTHRVAGFTGKTVRILSSASQYLGGTGGTISDDSSVVPTSGEKISIYA